MKLIKLDLLGPTLHGPLPCPREGPMQCPGNVLKSYSSYMKYSKGFPRFGENPKILPHIANKEL